MGFIHNTESEIFGIEERSESVFLQDLSADKTHLHIRYVRKPEVRDEIADAILKEAGNFFGKGEFGKAEEYKRIAEIVRHTAVSPDDKPRSFEATFEWVREMVVFFNKHPEILSE